MAFVPPFEKYMGKIREVTIGSGNSQITVGGENTLPFYLFEGEMSHKPVIAIEVYDVVPEEWSEVALEPFKDVINDPPAWAKKCQDQYQADLICLQLLGTDPTGKNRSPDEAAETVKSVLEAISIPLIVYGSGNVEKDMEVLKKVAQVAHGERIVLGPAQEDNYKSITAAALGFDHVVSGQTPIDVNMAKQLNILITNLGIDAQRVIMDPSTGALGYGLEYTYSVMERDKLAALQQNDAMMQMPLVCNLGREAWRAKEARATEEDEPSWGDVKKRGILWEALTAISLGLAGANILIMRHPEAVKLVRRVIDLLIEGE
ncbi:MAG: CO dehydrogenase/acetyl-CoA synthase subunit delta [Actinomycetota bacterium]|nr:CO dehydrogenase/acetyl-CoA synthase subunit delta [Actinomycetota bacterium]